MPRDYVMWNANLTVGHDKKCDHFSNNVFLEYFLVMGGEHSIVIKVL